MIIKIDGQYIKGEVQDICVHLEKMMYKRHRNISLAQEIRFANNLRLSRAIELARICGIKVKVIK